MYQAEIKNIYWTLQPVKLEGQDEAQSGKWSQMIYYLIFPTISLIPHGPKITRLNKIYNSTIKASLSEVNLSRIWINTIGHIYYWTLCLTLQCSLLCSILLELPIQDLTWWFHFFSFLHTDKNIFKQGICKGDIKQLRNSKHKGEHKNGFYPKFLLIFNAYQVQGWWNMILSQVKYQLYGNKIK